MLGEYVFNESSGEYVPYDLAQLMQRYDVSLERLFPKLDTATLQASSEPDLDFLAVAYERDLVHTSDAKATRDYLETRVNGRETAERVSDELESELVRLTCAAAGYRDWIAVAQMKARIDVTGAFTGSTEGVPACCATWSCCGTAAGWPSSCGG